MTYFYTYNASRKIKAGGYVFSFDPCTIVGDVWSGVFATNDEKEADALADIRGVDEITKETYDEMLKKKQQAQRLRNSGTLNLPDSNRGNPMVATPVAKDNLPSPVQPPTLESLESAIIAKPIVPAQPQETTIRRGPGRPPKPIQ